MFVRSLTAILLPSMALVLAAPLPAHKPESAPAAAGCSGFTRNLTRELAALKSPATLMESSTDPKVDPERLAEGQHVAATLTPQGSVRFAAPPGRGRKAENATAGLFFFKSGNAGRYRISITSRHWIDVLDAGKTIASLSHEGRSGCELLHKVVEFELPGNRDLVIQLSGDNAATVDLVITAVGKP